MNKDVSFEERIKAQIKMDSLPRNSSKNRFRNRCFFQVDLEVYIVNLVYLELQLEN